MSDTTTEGSGTVLFVDDDSATLSLYEEYFGGHSDVSPVTAPSVETARTKLREEPIDCIVSDGLYADDGELFVESASRTHADLPVILRSGDPPTDRDLHVDAVLQKGASDDSLATLDETIAERLALDSEAAASERRAEAAVPTVETSFRPERALGTWHWPNYTKGCWGQPGVRKCPLCRLRYAGWHLRQLV